MTKHLFAAVLLIAPLLSAQEGPAPTQALINLESKTPQTLTTQSVSVRVSNKESLLSSLVPVQPAGAQIAILIDDGLRSSLGRQIPDLKRFVTSLPSGTEIFIGYMENGRVVPAQPFTTDYAAAANSIRLPLGNPGISASPYFCLSDFVKKWPASSTGATRKARFVMMLTNGVDPYNGSTRITNQNSQYVVDAIDDAQRAGVAVYSIYYTEAGFGDRGSFSGQSYLAQVADGTGGRAYFQGFGNPVSITPFLQQFQRSIGETYIATFDAPGGKNLVTFRASTRLADAKLRAPEQVRPGNTIIAQ